MKLLTLTSFLLIAALFMYINMSNDHETESSTSITKSFLKNEKSVRKRLVGKNSRNKKFSTPEKLNVSKNERLHPIQTKILKLFKSKEYLQALAISENSLRDQGTPTSVKAWINGQLKTILLAVGFEYLQSSECEQAIDFLKRSYDFDQSRDSIKGLIYCYRDLGQIELAQALLDQAVTRGIYDLDILRMHSEVMETDQKLQESMEYYEKALEFFSQTGDDSSLAIIKPEIEKIKKKIAESENQRSFTSNNFFIKYNQVIDEQSAILVLEYLESTLIDLTQKYRFDLPRKPIEVVLYTNSGFFETNNKAPIWAEGLYDGRLRIPVQSAINSVISDRMGRVLKHELVHALIAEILRRKRLPTWIEEGLAQFISCEGQCAPIRGAGATSTFLTQEELEGSFTRLKRKKAVKAYTQSLYMIYFLQSEIEPSAVHRFIESFSQLGEISSDSILNFTTSQNFNNIYRRVRNKWMAAEPLPTN